MNWLRNTGLRIVLAFGLSLALWLFVTYTQNPDQRTTFEDVPVSIENLAPNLLLVDSDGLRRTTDPVVHLTVEAPQETLRGIRQSDMRVFVDLSGRGPGEHVVPVNIIATRSGLTQARFIPSPENVSLRLEQEITRTAAIQIQTIGSVPFSFVADPPRISAGGQPIGAVQVRGPATRVERVAKVRVSVDIDRLTANYNSPRPLEALSESGQVISGVALLPPQVDVLVPVRSSVGVKRVPIVPIVVGVPAPGFIVTQISLAPEFVTLTGSSGPLDRVEHVQTAPVNVAGSSQTASYTVAIDPPVAALIQAGEPTTVTVTVKIQPIARSFSLTLPAPIQATDFPPGYEVTLSPSVVQVTLSGTAATLGALNPAQLVGVVSLRNLPAGSYTATPVFSLPAGITLVGNPPRVAVVLRGPAPTASPSPAVTPSPSAEPPSPSAEPSPTPSESSPTAPTIPAATPDTTPPAATASETPGAAPTPGPDGATPTTPP